MSEAFQIQFHRFTITGKNIKGMPTQKTFYATGQNMHLIIRTYFNDGLLTKVLYFRKLKYDEEMAAIIVDFLVEYLKKIFGANESLICREFDFHE
jgi:hypothetical protein